MDCLQIQGGTETVQSINNLNILKMVVILVTVSILGLLLLKEQEAQLKQGLADRTAKTAVSVAI